MCKIRFFSFCFIIFFVISSCGITKNIAIFGVDAHNNKSNKGNLTSIDYKKGRLKTNGQFASRDRSFSGTKQFLKESRRKKGPSFYSYRATKGKPVPAPSSMRRLSARNKYLNIRVPKPIKKSDFSNRNIRLLKKDIRFKTKYGSGRPSIYDKRKKSDKKSNFNPKTYKKSNKKFLFINFQKKSMHKYEVIQQPKKKRGLNFWSNPFKKDKRKSNKALRKINKKKRKPEMELFDPKANVM